MCNISEVFLPVVTETGRGVSGRQCSPNPDRIITLINMLKVPLQKNSWDIIV